MLGLMLLASHILGYLMTTCNLNALFTADSKVANNIWVLWRCDLAYVEAKLVHSRKSNFSQLFLGVGVIGLDELVWECLAELVSSKYQDVANAKIPPAVIFFHGFPQLREINQSIGGWSTQLITKLSAQPNDMLELIDNFSVEMIQSLVFSEQQKILAQGVNPIAFATYAEVLTVLMENHVIPAFPCNSQIDNTKKFNTKKELHIDIPVQKIRTKIKEFLFQEGSEEEIMRDLLRAKTARSKGKMVRY